MLNFAKTRTPIGELTLVEKSGKLLAIHFEGDGFDISGLKREKTSLLNQCETELREFFAGKRKTFDIPLDLSDKPEFYLKVWGELQKIPFGEVDSYKGIAIKVGSPKAYRAVGQANNKNPIPIVIPCHRVVGTSGKLIGYAGGLDIKEQLINIEKENINS